MMGARASIPAPRSPRYIRRAPSPAAPTAVRSGCASLAATAAGSANPIAWNRPGPRALAQGLVGELDTRRDTEPPPLRTLGALAPPEVKEAVPNARPQEAQL